MTKEVESSHRLLSFRPLKASLKAIDYKPVLAMLLVARWGNFDISSLRVVGTSLALLHLGVAEHYSGQSRKSRNLALVAGDYWYARAMTLASSLGDVRITELLAKVIFELVEAEEGLKLIENQKADLLSDLLEGRGSFYKAAFQSGILLGGFQGSRVAEILTRLGKEVAILSQLKELWGESKKRIWELCRSEITIFLEELEEGRHKSELRQLIGDIEL